MITKRRATGYLLISFFYLLLTACGGGGSDGDTTTGGGDTTGDPSASTSISNVVFSDPSLKECVQSEATKNGWLLTDEVTNIDCSQSNIQLLNGLQSFANLETLNLSNNRIADVTPLAGLTKLSVIDLSDMPRLRNIDTLLALDNLTDVNLSGSGSEDITCASLDTLSLNANSVNEPAICTQLIADVIIADTALKSCIDSSVELNDFAFTYEVVSLECEDAGIAQLDGIESFANLVSINIDSNLVSDLSPLGQLAKLKFFSASENPITDVFALSELPALTTLDLGGIPGLSNVDVLLNSTSLDELTLDGTGGGDLDCTALDNLSAQFTTVNRPIACDMLIADVVFEDFRLEDCVLEKAGGFITRTSELTVLTQECQGKGITSLAGLENFHNLTALDLSSNSTLDLSPLSNMFKLRGLTINNNNGVKSFDALNRLTELRLIEARSAQSLEDVSAILDMEFVKFLRLDGAGTATFLGISCAVLDELEADILARQIGDPTALSEMERPGFCDATPPVGNNILARTDMDNDQKSDILLETVDTLTWQMGLTDAISTVPSFVLGTSFAEASKAKGIAVADANNDQKDDLLIQIDNVDGTRQWQVLISDGDALSKFSGLLSLDDAGIEDDARAVAFTDIDGDGNADILIQSQVASSVRYHTSFATGFGYAAPELLYQFSTGLGRPEIIALEDVNNDGTGDFVFSRVLNNEYCFFVRTFDDITDVFEEQSRKDECASTRVFDGNKIEIIGVADVAGNGNSELVVRKSNAGRNNWFFYSLTQGESGSEWSKGATGLLTTDLAPGSTESFIALTDLDQDGRVDILNEVTLGPVRTWVAYIAKDYGLYETQTWSTDDSSLVQEQHRRNTLGVRDYNGDGFPDLLVEESSDTIAQLIRVRLGDGASFESAPLFTWHSKVLARSNVIGVEEFGLTNMAHDKSALISKVGSSTKHTVGELRAELAVAGLTLELDSSNISVDAPLETGSCTIASAGSFAENNKVKASFGALVCTEQIGDHVSVTVQALHGECESSNGLSVLSGSGETGILQCKTGLFKREVEVDLGAGVSTTIEAQGPNADFCAGSTPTGACAKIGGNLISTAGKIKIGDNNSVGAGIGIGLGAGGSAVLEDGIFSASGELKIGAGIQIDLEIDLNPVISFGEDAILFTETGADIIILAAGDGVFGDVVGGSFAVLGESISVATDLAEIGAGHAMYMLTAGPSFAVAVFTSIIDGDLTAIFDSLQASLDETLAVITDVAGVVADGLVTVFDGIASIF